MMKILTHRTDNTAYARGVRNCRKFLSHCGIDFYFVEDLDYDSREYFCHIKGTVDLMKPLGLNDHLTVEEAEQRIKSIPEDRLVAFCTVEGELKRIENAVNAKQWTSNAEAYFCELMGKDELAERARKNRAAIYEQREREEREKEQRKIAEQASREADEREKIIKQTERAEQSLRAGDFISPADFELLAEKYDVKLPIKFVGWLREWCGDIQIKKRAKPIPSDTWDSKYETRYYCNNGHQSTSIWKYADALAEAVGL